MYYNGQGFEKNLPEALRWYQAAASQDHPHALYMLYLMYSRGTAVAADRTLALEYLNRAAREGSEHAVAELKRLRESPEGSPQSK